MAFLLDYLDDTIRHRADLEILGLPIWARSHPGGQYGRCVDAR